MSYGVPIKPKTNMSAWRRQDGSVPSTESKNGGANSLARCITELVHKGIGKRVKGCVVRDLPGGARLWWDEAARRLYATRLNAPLQPAEASTFARHIRAANVKHGPARSAHIVESELNEWYGVFWIIGDDVAPVATAQEKLL